MHIDNSKEYVCERENADTVILFVHGIIEGPNQFEDFIENVDDDVSVVNVLLTGHGGTQLEFAQSSMQLWQQDVDSWLVRLSKSYERIFIVGHSMGCLLAVDAATRYPEKVKGLFLLAIPLCIRVRFIGMINGLKIALKMADSNNKYTAAALKAYSIEQQSLPGYLKWLPRYVELFIKGIQTRKLMYGLKIPVEVYMSYEDEFVGIRTVKYLANSNVHILVKSGHFYYYDDERRAILDRFMEFIK